MTEGEYIYKHFLKEGILSKFHNSKSSRKEIVSAINKSLKEYLAFNSVGNKKKPSTYVDSINKILKAVEKDLWSE